MDQRELFERARKACNLRCVSNGWICQEPSQGLGDVDPGPRAARLDNVPGVLATYQWDGQRLMATDEVPS